jgi:uncharacterized protein
MTVTIFGATGMVGKRLVKQALFMGYTVRAYGRNVFTTDFPDNENLQIVKGALFDGGAVRNAIKGSDAVLSAIGGAADGTDKTRSLGMKIIAEQMEKAGVKRIVAIGGMGVLDAPDGTILMEGEDYPRQYLAVGMEHFKAYEHLKDSDLQWTFIGSPDLVDADATGLFHTAANTPPTPNNFKINAGDLALFMLNEVTKNNFLRQRVGISN